MECFSFQEFLWERMKITNARNHHNAVINMSKRVKTKPKVRANEMTRKNVVDKESADRIAAAEAMSCLSSTPFILPSSSDFVDQSVTGQRDITEPTVNNASDHDTSAAVPKRGKSKNRGRGSKRSSAKIPQTNLPSVEGKVSERNSIVSATTSRESPKPDTSQQSLINFQSVNLASSSQASFIAQQLSNLVKIHKEKHEKADAMPSHSNIKFSLQQMLELKMAQSHEKSQSNSNNVLKLPLVVSSVERKETRDTVSPGSVTSSESIELTQTTVDNILNSNKYDTPEASLPLKKRRLQTYKDGEIVTTESGLLSQGVVELTTVKQEQDVKEAQGNTIIVLNSFLNLNLSSIHPHLCQNVES